MTAVDAPDPEICNMPQRHSAPASRDNVKELPVSTPCHLLVRAFPVLPGQEATLDHAFAEMRRRSAETRDFYRRHGVDRESAFLQETPSGPLLLVVTHFGAPPPEETIRSYVASEQDFDHWFKEQVQRVTGVDPAVTPLGPPTRCVFDTDAL
jgi:hypothetical protein